MKELLNRILWPSIATVLALTSWVNLREVRILRSDRALRSPQFHAGQLPAWMEQSYPIVGRQEVMKLSELKAPILAIYFVKANDCIGVIPEVGELKSKFGGTLDVAIFAVGINDEERGQLRRLFDDRQIVLDCGDCKRFVEMRLLSPLLLLVDRTAPKLLIEDRAAFTTAERNALAVKIERLLNQRGYRIPTA